jgi:hypothetical protein
MERLLESFSALKEEFVDDPAILGTIDHEINSHGNALPKWTMSPKRIGRPLLSVKLIHRTILLLKLRLTPARLCFGWR